MADQLFYKRKAREANSLKRKQAKRAPYDRVLIVCEGEKTEPSYLQALIDDLKLNTANIRIVPNTTGSAPISVVAHALKEYTKAKREKENYDQVYCVFDQDLHPNYNDALSSVEEKRREGCPISAITSVPCFEFWILLHFRYTTRPFQEKNGSICADVISHLKKHLPNYQKGKEDVYSITKTHLPQAMNHAKRVLRHCETGNTDMPSTKIHKLVEYLQNLKK